MKNQFSAAQQDLTFLSMVRTDPSQITSLLDSSFAQADSLESADEKALLKKNFEQYFDQCKQYLFGQINHQQAANALKQSSAQSGKGVCAKTLSYGDVAWKCETCEKDPTCIICQECFELGDHKGHKVWLKRNVGGCCDCGDPDAWAEEGFCQKHKGYSASSEVLLEQLPPFIKRSALYVFRHVGLQLKLQCLELQVATAEQSKGYLGYISPSNKNQLQRKLNIIHLLFEFMDWTVDVSPAFIHFWTETLNEHFLSEVRQESAKLGLKHPAAASQEDDDTSEYHHKCCTRAYISEVERKNFAQKLQKIIVEEDGLDSIYLASHTESTSGEDATAVVFSEETLQELRGAKGICTCNVMDLTFQVNHIVTNKTRNLQYELYFKMFQSFKFKQVLGMCFASNFEVISLERSEKDHNIGSIGVQILTIDEISLMILQDQNLRNNILTTFGKTIDQLVETEFSDKAQEPVIHVLFDIKYMTRAKTLKYAIEECSFLESLLEQAQKLYYMDTTEHRTQHIMFDQSIYKECLYNIDIQLTKVIKAFMKAIDFSDVQRNKRIMSSFIQFFENIEQKMPDEESQLGFFAVPLHRLFSYYFSRLILQNYMRESASDKKPKAILVDIFRKFTDIPVGQNAWRYLQGVVEMILRPLAKAWAFTHEILSGKWVMSGLYINQLPTLLYGVFEYYLLLSLGLFQILISVSPEPHKTIELILQAFCSDPWMRIFDQRLLESRSLQQGDMAGFNKLFDVKKLRQMIHWELRLMIQLAVTEVPLLYPLLTNLNRKENLSFPVQSACNEQIEGAMRQETRRGIVHALILCGGRADFKQLKQALPSQELYMTSDFFEEELEAVTTQHRDGQGAKVLFKLKEEPYLQWFDPYYYLKPESQTKAQEVIQTVYQEKKLINEVLGDYQGAFAFSTRVNQVIREGLASNPHLLKIVASLINIWCTTAPAATQQKVVDEQIAYECLKLLHLMTKSSSDPSLLLAVIRDKNSTLVQNLQAKAQSMAPGSVLDIAIREVLLVIYQSLSHLHSTEFSYIAEFLGLNQSSTDSPTLQTTANLDTDENTQLDLKRQMSRKRQEDILKKFKEKRQGFMKTAAPQTSTDSTPMMSRQSSSMKNDTTFTTGEEDSMDEITCSFCRETLNMDQFYGQPYGHFAYVSQTKLLYHAYRQTLQSLANSNDGQEKEEKVKEEEEEKKQSEIDKEQEQKQQQEKAAINPLEVLDVNCLEPKMGTGGALIKCSHYAHNKCLASYLTANEKDQRKRDLRKIIGLDFETFQCPLCKHIANVLLPCGTLTNYKDQMLYQKDFEPYELLEFFTRLISKIVQRQENKKNETLPVDIKKNPEGILQAMQKFIEHRLQLISIKGLEEFLRSHHRHANGSRAHFHNRVGKEQYADLLEITRNIIQIVLEGQIPLGQMGSQFDVDMSEMSLDEICLEQITLVFQSRKGWKLLESDFSSIVLQLMFYTSILIGFGDHKKLDFYLDLIAKGVFSMFKLQTLIKAQFSSVQSYYTSSNSLVGTPSELLHKLSNFKSLLALSGGGGDNLPLPSTNQQFFDQFITPSQLGFLRKAASFKVLAHTVFVRTAAMGVNKADFVEASFISEAQSQLEAEDLKAKDEDFIAKVTQQFDDAEELAILKAYLNMDAAGQAHEGYPVPDELQEVLSYLQSEEQQEKALESYALSILINLLNPGLAIKSFSHDSGFCGKILDQQNTPIIKDQILQREEQEEGQKSEDRVSLKQVKLEMPPAFKVFLHSNLIFKLQELPNDFQSLIQTYYKRKCRNCDKQPKESCVCLLCGEIVCFLQKCCSGNLPGMKINEGELSYHARTYEGGSALYLWTTNGKIILVEDERSSQRPSPYMNKFGETFSSNSKKWDNYHLQCGNINGSSTSGNNIYDEIRKFYVNFSLADEIIKDRGIAEVVWRLRAI